MQRLTELSSNLIKEIFFGFNFMDWFLGLIITGKLYGSSLCFGPGENHNGGDFVNLWEI